jgi:hypothetical protein
VPDREQYLRDICHEQGIPCLFLRPRFLEEVTSAGGRGNKEFLFRNVELAPSTADENMHH